MGPDLGPSGPNVAQLSSGLATRLYTLLVVQTALLTCFKKRRCDTIIYAQIRIPADDDVLVASLNKVAK